MTVQEAKDLQEIVGANNFRYGIREFAHALGRRPDEAWTKFLYSSFVSLAAEIAKMDPESLALVLSRDNPLQKAGD